MAITSRRSSISSWSAGSAGLVLVLIQVCLNVVETLGEFAHAAAVAHVFLIDTAHFIAQAVGLAAGRIELLLEHVALVIRAGGTPLQLCNAGLGILELLLQGQVLVQKRLGLFRAVQLHNGAQLFIFSLQCIALAGHAGQFLLGLRQGGFKLHDACLSLHPGIFAGAVTGFHFSQLLGEGVNHLVTSSTLRNHLLLQLLVAVLVHLLLHAGRNKLFL